MARMITHPLIIDDADREAFLAGVRPHPSGCHFHIRSRSAGAYVTVPLRGRHHRAHRVALAIKLGRDIRDRYLACHACDVPACVNPEHLFEGDGCDNLRDASVKGRLRRTSARIRPAYDRVPAGTRYAGARFEMFQRSIPMTWLEVNYRASGRRWGGSPDEWTRDLCDRLASAFGLDANWLWDGTGSPPPDDFDVPVVNAAPLPDLAAWRESQAA